jgi:hypothetical protein
MQESSEPNDRRREHSAPPSAPALFVARYADDDPYLFAKGTRMRFGRDDGACDIPIWEQLHRRTLSRIAGELWCMNGQMWVRNLSVAHELVVAGPGVATSVLPARTGGDPGHGCSVPTAPVGVVSAPSTGTWLILIAAVKAGDNPEGVARSNLVLDIPEGYRAVAEALCAPLLAGKSTPATYAQIAVSVGTTERIARRRVEALCEYYRDQVEALPGGRRPDETLTSAVARFPFSRGMFRI